MNAPNEDPDPIEQFGSVEDLNGPDDLGPPIDYDAWQGYEKYMDQFGPAGYAKLLKDAADVF